MEGQTLTFDVFGAYHGAFVMHDEQTGTVWAHLTGEALVGPLVGRRLRHEPVQMTTFERWLEMHPDSFAPDPAASVAPEPFRPGDPELGEGFQATMSSWDERLPQRQLVLGVVAGGVARAYLVDPDRPGPRLLQDELGEVPIALLAPEGAWPLAYDRRVDGETAELRLEGDRVVDAGGRWWLPDGTREDGGAALTYLPSYITEWYAWAAYHDGTEIADGR